MKVLDSFKMAGSRNSNEPRLVGNILEDMLRSNSPLAQAYRQRHAIKEGGRV